jgi:8-oxo-dGTP pyrophosphatase MutT (NUDIX family)
MSVATTRFLPKQTTVCTNCGVQGHHYKQCTAPITSYGILAFRINKPSWNQAAALAKDEWDCSGIPDQSLEYLLIQRKDSIGYIELLRAKYKLTDLDYIRQQIAGTTAAERHALIHSPFYDLWTGLWGPMTNVENRQYKQEYEQAKSKFELLRDGVAIGGLAVTLADLIATTPLEWDTPEWGFPKGRRNAFESDFQCALREFTEETGLTANQIRIFENMEPIRESFIGNNAIHYCHVYYLAWVSNNVDVRMKTEHPHMSREIGGIGWFSQDEAFKRIRPTNIEKREILLRACLFLQHTCPLLVGPVAELADEQTKKEAELTNRSKGDEPSNHSTRFTPTNPWTRRPAPTPAYTYTLRSEYGFVEEPS